MFALILFLKAQVTYFKHNCHKLILALWKNARQMWSTYDNCGARLLNVVSGKNV